MSGHDAAAAGAGELPLWTAAWKARQEADNQSYSATYRVRFDDGSPIAGVTWEDASLVIDLTERDRRRRLPKAVRAGGACRPGLL